MINLQIIEILFKGEFSQNTINVCKYKSRAMLTLIFQIDF